MRIVRQLDMGVNAWDKSSLKIRQRMSPPTRRVGRVHACLRTRRTDVAIAH